MSVQPAIAFPVDRWFTCSRKGHRGLIETFSYHPLDDVARVTFNGEQFEIEFREKDGELAPFGRVSEPPPRIQEHAKSYRPTVDELKDIILQELYTDLMKALNNPDPIKHPFYGVAYERPLKLNLGAIAMLDGWLQSLEGSDFQEVVPKLKKKFFNYFTNTLVKRYKEFRSCPDSTIKGFYEQVSGERLGNAFDISHLRKRLIEIADSMYIGEIINILKAHNFNGEVTKLTQAINKAKKN